MHSSPPPSRPSPGPPPTGGRLPVTDTEIRFLVRRVALALAEFEDALMDGEEGVVSRGNIDRMLVAATPFLMHKAFDGTFGRSS